MMVTRLWSSTSLVSLLHRTPIFFSDSSSHVVAWAQCMLGIFAPYKLLHLWLLNEEKNHSEIISHQRFPNKLKDCNLSF